jgi:hypothetical protein
VIVLDVTGSEGGQLSKGRMEAKTVFSRRVGVDLVGFEAPSQPEALIGVIEGDGRKQWALTRWNHFTNSSSYVLSQTSAIPLPSNQSGRHPEYTC